MSGWIVRSGIKFGSDFGNRLINFYSYSFFKRNTNSTTVLYKHGPEFYHSTYSVQVVNWLDNNQKNNIQDWIQLATINRITESSAKVKYILMKNCFIQSFINSFNCHVGSTDFICHFS